MRRAASLLVLALAAAVTLAPFVYMVAVSLAAQGTVYAGSVLPMPSLAAAHRNYGDALTQVPLLRYMANGAFVCAVILVAQITIAAPAGYALAKLPFRGRPILLGMVIVALMIPMQVPAIPLYVAVAYAGLLNTYTALIVPFVISAFAIFLFRQFFLSYPDEVLDAARLDGFSELGIVWRLMVPAAWPAVAAFATISIINHWNDLYWPLVVVTDRQMMTPPLGLATFRSSGESTGNVGALMAGGVMVTAPLVIAFMFFQRALIRGLGLGART
ncbi:carbohydrate ABC transporter permease [Jannaschia sp. S6380]|uniref:carbohydrate ABC transporter permease n=1 Tax=Jannaschia sp. S6380 TaxID=2926408 RepID=UPI001FF6098D|nr:carbohydrate ABC transporter permease [Jannaschia sp. S6380]MCK0167700.1 carbohydrate ABC transporter permease [Jannaschia sp. S6380]